MQWQHPQQTPIAVGPPDNSYCKQHRCDTRLLYKAGSEVILDTSSAALVQDKTMSNPDTTAPTGLVLKFPGKLQFPLVQQTRFSRVGCAFDSVPVRPFTALEDIATKDTMLQKGSAPQIMGLGLGKKQWAEGSLMAQAPEGSKRFAFQQTTATAARMCFGKGCRYDAAKPPPGAQRFRMLDSVCADDPDCLLHNGERNKLRYPAAAVADGNTVRKVVFDTGANVDSVPLDPSRNIYLHGLQNFNYLYVDYDHGVIDVRFKKTSPTQIKAGAQKKNT